MSIFHPTVHVVVVTYQQYQFTERCVQSLFACGYFNLHLWLVDNASDTTVYEPFRDRYNADSRCTLIRSEKNLGYGGGCNLALQQIRDGYIAILNNDTEVGQGWLEPIIDAMERDKKIGACQPKIKDIARKKYFEYAGAAGGCMDVYGYPFARGRIFYTVEQDNGQYDTMTDVAWCSGTAFVTRADVIRRVGFFDEIFFMYAEEADWCWRVNHAGYRLTCIGESVVYHHGEGTMRHRMRARKIFYLHRNGIILLLKNYTVWEWWLYITRRVIFDAITLLYYVVLRPWNLNWAALLLAYVHLTFLFPKILYHHMQIRSFRIGSKVVHPPLYQRSIVIDYFLLGKRRSSDLQTFL